MSSVQAAGVSPAAKIEKVHLDWHQQQADKKKSAMAKHGKFEQELRKRMEAK